MSNQSGGSAFVCPNCFSEFEYSLKMGPSKDKPRRRYPISIVCVSKCDTYALPFLERMHNLADYLAGEFLLAIDVTEDHEKAMDWVISFAPYADRVIPVQTKGYVESVLDKVLGMVNGLWVLRLDDDESVPPAMEITVGSICLHTRGTIYAFFTAC